jgi:hypothetical protein
VLAIAAGASAQVHTAVVLDQAEQPLPGATVSLIRGATVVATTVTNAAGNSPALGGGVTAETVAADAFIGTDEGQGVAPLNSVGLVVRGYMLVKW